MLNKTMYYYIDLLDFILSDCSPNMNIIHELEWDAYG